MPKGIFRNSYEPFGVTKAVFGISSSSIVTCQYPLLRSIFKKNLSPFSFWNRSTGGWRRDIRNRKTAPAKIAENRKKISSKNRNKSRNCLSFAKLDNFSFCYFIFICLDLFCFPKLFSVYFLVSVELIVVWKFAYYYFGKSALKTYGNVKLEKKMHNKMIVGDFS